MDEQSKQSSDSNLESKFGLTEFDSDLSPEHPANQKAAAQRGLSYDSHLRAYTDEDGCLIRDEFGQPF